MGLENYHLQEDALNKLFLSYPPKNTDVTDILLKASTLNQLLKYEHLFNLSVQAYLHLDIVLGLKREMLTLVGDIQHVTIGDTEKNFTPSLQNTVAITKSARLPIL